MFKNCEKITIHRSSFVQALQKHESGIATGVICREMGIAPATLSKWKAKYGGLDVSDVQKLKTLEEEHSRLKRMYADLAMDNQLLRDLFSKKRLGPATKRQIAEELVRDHGVPVSRACKLASIPRSKYYYQSAKDDSDIIESLQELSGQHPTYGFRKLFAYLRRRGKAWNHKRVYRVYKLLKMNQKRRGKRRLPARVRQPLQQAVAFNHSWSMDFMSDSIMGVRKFRTFNVMDDCTREALAIEIDTSLSSKRIIRTLESVIAWRGKPKLSELTTALNSLPKF